VRRRMADRFQSCPGARLPSDVADAPQHNDRHRYPRTHDLRTLRSRSEFLWGVLQVECRNAIRHALRLRAL
jgi:hypothetical protein